MSIIQILFLKAVLADRIPNKHSNYQNGHKDVREFASLHSYRIPICRLLFFRFDFLYFLFYFSDWYWGRNNWRLSFFDHFQKYSFGIIFADIFNLVVKLIVLVNIEVFLVLLDDLRSDHLVRYVKYLNFGIVLFLY